MPLPPHRRLTRIVMMVLISQVICSMPKMSFVSILISISDKDR